MIRSICLLRGKSARYTALRCEERSVGRHSRALCELWGESRPALRVRRASSSPSWPLLTQPERPYRSPRLPPYRQGDLADTTFTRLAVPRNPLDPDEWHLPSSSAAVTSLKFLQWAVPFGSVTPRRGSPSAHVRPTKPSSRLMSVNVQAPDPTARLRCRCHSRRAAP